MLVRLVQEMRKIMKKDKNEWTYCEGCEGWFLDDEDCNCEQ